MSTIAPLDTTWSSIDKQSDLDTLVDSVDWSDAETVAFVGTVEQSQSFFPPDVSRSGDHSWNIRLVMRVLVASGDHLEVVLIDCDEFSAKLFRNFSLRGRVDTLKRVEVNDRNNQRVLRCSRLLYRFLTMDQMEARKLYGFGP